MLLYLNILSLHHFTKIFPQPLSGQLLRRGVSKYAHSRSTWDGTEILHSNPRSVVPSYHREDICYFKFFSCNSSLYIDLFLMEYLHIFFFGIVKYNVRLISSSVQASCTGISLINITTRSFSQLILHSGNFLLLKNYLPIMLSQSFFQRIFPPIIC